MSNSNYILDSLGLKDKHLSFNENLITFKIIRGVKYKILHASLSYSPSHCSCCGCINENHLIIKYGFKSSTITIGDLNNHPTLLRIRKQRFLCKSCGHTFSAHSDIVNPNCFISNNVKHKIALDSRLKRSEKDISRDNHVSHSTVNSIINSYEKTFSINRSHLPEHLSFDEFKAVKKTKGKMAFIMINAKNSNVIDIVENRQYSYLNKYFRLYTKKARNTVKTITIDMYTPYISLIKILFPNAKIIIDKFHVVQLISRSLNQTRVNLMKRNKKNYNKLKRYWKLILMDRDKLDDNEYKNYTCFSSQMREIDIVDYLLSIDQELNDTYDVYQDLLYAIKQKDNALFTHTLSNAPTSISSYMQTSIKTLSKYTDYIKNTFTYSYTNGRIEGINNLIKVIKRIAFGYRHFSHLKTRILIICRSPLHLRTT